MQRAAIRRLKVISTRHVLEENQNFKCHWSSSELTTCPPLVSPDLEVGTGVDRQLLEKPFRSGSKKRKELSYHSEECGNFFSFFSSLMPQASSNPVAARRAYRSLKLWGRKSSSLSRDPKGVRWMPFSFYFFLCSPASWLQKRVQLRDRAGKTKIQHSCWRIKKGSHRKWMRQESVEKKELRKGTSWGCSLSPWLTPNCHCVDLNSVSETLGNNLWTRPLPRYQTAIWATNMRNKSEQHCKSFENRSEIETTNFIGYKINIQLSSIE